MKSICPVPLLDHPITREIEIDYLNNVNVTLEFEVTLSGLVVSECAMAINELGMIKFEKKRSEQ